MTETSQNKLTMSILNTLVIVAIILFFIPFDYSRAVAYIILGVTTIAGFLSYSFDTFMGKSFTTIRMDLILMVLMLLLILSPIAWMTTLHFQFNNVFKNASVVPKLPTMMFFFNVFVLGSVGTFTYNLNALTSSGKQTILMVSLFSLLLVYMVSQTIHYFITDDINLPTDSVPAIPIQM
jgi:hypothetical protein